MTFRPCTICGEPSDRSRCPEHSNQRPGARDPRHVHNNPTRWKHLARRARRTSPFCELCGTHTNLTVDHIIPVAVEPDLAYTIENCRVLCRRCNSRRGATYTTSDAQGVLKRLQTAQDRRPATERHRHIKAAERAAQHQGGYPKATPKPSRGQAEFTNEIPA